MHPSFELFKTFQNVPMDIQFKLIISQMNVYNS